MTLTTDPEEARNSGTRADGQQNKYVVLSDEERAKGFVRPVRLEYKHIGIRPTHPTRDLTPEEHERYDQYGYVKFEAYPCAKCGGPSDGSLHDDEPRAFGGGFDHHFVNIDGSSVTGTFWTAERLASGCGGVTKMATAIAETYARNPGFYSGTFCVGCGKHFPVGAAGEFVWLDDGTRVGT